MTRPVVSSCWRRLIGHPALTGGEERFCPCRSFTAALLGPVRVVIDPVERGRGELGDDSGPGHWSALSSVGRLLEEYADDSFATILNIYQGRALVPLAGNVNIRSFDAQMSPSKDRI